MGNLGTTDNDEPPAPPLEPPPEPPTSPPLDPTEIVRLVVLGDRRVGKSSVVQKFVTRRYCNPNEDGGDDDGKLHADAADTRSVRSGRSHKSHRSSRSHRSEKSQRRRHRDRDGTGRHRKATATSSSRYQMSPDGSHVSGRSADSRVRHNHNDGGIELIKAEYHKKDVTMWLPAALNSASVQSETSKVTKKRSALRKVSENHSSSYVSDDDGRDNGKAKKAKDEQDQVCARVQVWDATGQDCAPLEDVDDAGAQDRAHKATIISTDSKWSQIFRNAAGAVIVCTLGEDDDSGSSMAGQYLDRQVIMENLERRVRRWLALVDVFTSSPSSADGGRADNSDEANATHRIPVTLILNKSDQISNVLSSSDWVRVGAQMERLCEHLGIDGGLYTSTCLPPESADIAQDSSSNTSSGSWNEDHDGAEMAFLSQVRSNLLAKREPSVAGEVESDNKKANVDRREDKSPRRRSKSQTKGGRRSSSRRRRSRSRSRPRTAPNFPIDP